MNTSVIFCYNVQCNNKRYHINQLYETIIIDLAHESVNGQNSFVLGWQVIFKVGLLIFVGLPHMSGPQAWTTGLAQPYSM